MLIVELNFDHLGLRSAVVSTAWFWTKEHIWRFSAVQVVWRQKTRVKATKQLNSRQFLSQPESFFTYVTTTGGWKALQPVSEGAFWLRGEHLQPHQNKSSCCNSTIKPKSSLQMLFDSRPGRDLVSESKASFQTWHLETLILSVGRCHKKWNTLRWNHLWISEPSTTMTMWANALVESSCCETQRKFWFQISWLCCEDPCGWAFFLFFFFLINC